MKDSLKEAFLYPSHEFTPIPFWFWNNALDEKEITRQIEDFYAKGICGFVIHPRVGLPEDIPYLSDRFMHYVKYAVSEAARLNMKIVLYDEAMYPSGSAHGMVVQGNPEFASRCICMKEYRELNVSPDLPAGDTILCAQAVRKDSDGKILPETIQELEVKDGTIRFTPPEAPEGGAGINHDCSAWSILVFTEGFSQGTIRGIHFGEDDKEPGAPASGDLLNPDAMDKFIRITYDRYYEVLKEYFGTTVIAMFTDEPDELGRCHRPGCMPWTIGFMDWWIQYGGSKKDLPYLWLESENSAAVRKQFRKAVNQRLKYSYYSRISKWCEQHGIALTGHPQKSDDIGFLKYFHIPGQDIVWRWVAPELDKGITGRDSTMGKCSSDAARHSGRRRNSNECFGCCGPDGIQWAFRAGDMKWYLDWMFVRGVNLLYPHAFFYSLEGEKRFGERPPDVGPHNIWWQDYRFFSDYIKRMSWLMTDSFNTTPVAILCSEDNLPWQLAKELYRNQIEFNYLEDTLLRDGSCDIENGTIKIQKQSYSVLLVENPELLDEELQETLAPFVNNGGHLIVYPADGCLRPTANNTAPHCEDIIAALDACCCREVRVTPACPDLRVSHVVKEGRGFYVLVNEGEQRALGRIKVPAVGGAELWDAWNGTCTPVQTETADDTDWMEIPFCLERRESLIVSVNRQGDGSPAAQTGWVLSTHDASKTDLLKWRITSVTQAQAVKEAGLSSHGLTHFSCCSSADTPDTPDYNHADNIALTSWTEWPGMENFSGAVTYETEFTCSPTPETQHWLLDLGEVYETVHLKVNGRNAGFRLWGPYRFDITPYVKSGSNLISLEIANTLANGMSGAKLPSGLLGPVKLLCCPDSQIK